MGYESLQESGWYAWPPAKNATPVLLPGKSRQDMSVNRGHRETIAKSPFALSTEHQAIWNFHVCT